MQYPLEGASLLFQHFKSYITIVNIDSELKQRGSIKYYTFVHITHMYITYILVHTLHNLNFKHCNFQDYMLHVPDMENFEF